MADRRSRSPGSSSALSSISEDEGAPPSSPSHSTVSEIDDSTIDPAMPPAKKRKTNARAGRPVSPQPGDSPTLQLDDFNDPNSSDISSDTSGSVPPSPRPHPGGQPATVDEAGLATDQVRICAWDGCDAGDLGDQDMLIRHVNSIHVGQKGPKAKYPCEWIDCKAKGKQHGSAYSLRNHMKSHTKERAHYCSLPECDRSFTRSDALHKHMRTVHESESFRTAEHYPKQRSHNIASAVAPPSPASITSPVPPPSAAGQNMTGDENGTKAGVPTKITLKLSSKEETKEPMSPESRAETCPVSAADGFTPEEAAMPRDELLRLLRRQIAWAHEDRIILMREVDRAEELRKQSWMDKELMLENVLEAEVMNGLNKGAMRNEVWMEGKRRQLDDEDLDMAARLPLNGEKAPWYRDVPHLRKSRPMDEPFRDEPLTYGARAPSNRPLSGESRPNEALKSTESQDIDMDQY